MIQKFKTGQKKNQTRESKAVIQDVKLEEYKIMLNKQYELQRHGMTSERFTGADNRLNVKLEKIRNPLKIPEVIYFKKL